MAALPCVTWTCYLKANVILSRLSHYSCLLLVFILFCQLGHSRSAPLDRHAFLQLAAQALHTLRTRNIFVLATAVSSSYSEVVLRKTIWKRQPSLTAHAPYNYTTICLWFITRKQLKSEVYYAGHHTAVDCNKLCKQSTRGPVGMIRCRSLCLIDVTVSRLKLKCWPISCKCFPLQDVPNPREVMWY